MAKIRHNNFLNSVVEVMTNAKEEGALHLYAEGDTFNGRYIKIKGADRLHFGTTGYLGLEQDERLKQASIDAIQRYGTQFPLSKSYISHPLYETLEKKVRQIYDENVIITKNSTLGHMAVIPSIVNDGDGVILDHQVHWSVQNAVQPLKLRSVPVHMIRHNNLQMLEDKIRELSSKCSKIWYMADGIYSMYGDYAPLEELVKLSEKYTQLHLYFDDVHGMSWKGRNGSGYVLSELIKLPEKVVLFGTLSKTFGASGAVMVCTDKKRYNKIKNFGGPLTFSAQLEPASVGAAIASADIHLSDEIYELQNELRERTDFFNDCLSNTNLPLISKNDSPVFYIGTGMPETGYNLVNRLLGEGIYVNLGIFPAVPVKNTGLRITISRHNQKEDIKTLTETLNHHYYKSLEDTMTNVEKVKFAFGMSAKPKPAFAIHDSSLKLELYRSIHEIDREEWNDAMGGESILDWEGCSFMENVFEGNPEKENNYEFYYFKITDGKGQLLVMAIVTFCLWKEDMLAPVSVSMEIEKIRKENPYAYTSHTLSLGTFLTEGNHLYVNREHKSWEEGVNRFLIALEGLEVELDPQSILLRDFEVDDPEINALLHRKGFVKVSMPKSCYYDNFNWATHDEYIASLSKRSQKHFKKDIAPYLEMCDLLIKQKVSTETLEIYFKLYLEVKENNPALNTFSYPYKLFVEMNSSSLWEFIELRIKDHIENPIVGVMFCYKNRNISYVPNLIGMDYQYSREFQVYRQLLFQTILRAKQLNYKRIDFGLTAEFEKRKVGAQCVEKTAYIQAKDNFALEALDWLRND